MCACHWTGDQPTKVTLQVLFYQENLLGEYHGGRAGFVKTIIQF